MSQPRTTYNGTLIARIVVYYDRNDPDNRGWAVRWDCEDDGFNGFDGSEPMERTSPSCSLPVLLRELTWIDDLPPPKEWVRLPGHDGWEWRA